MREFLLEETLTKIGVPKTKLEYLEEYLIISDGIDGEEAKSLMEMVILEAKVANKKIDEAVARKKSFIQKTYKKMVKEAKGAKAKLIEAKEWFVRQMTALAKWARKAKKAVVRSARTAGSSIKTGFEKGVAKTGKMGKTVQKFAAKHPGKLGLAAAGAAGLYAYQKSKEKAK